MSTPTAIEIVRAQNDWWKSGLGGVPPHFRSEYESALASVLRDAERFKDLERAHRSAQTHQGWSTRIKETREMHPRRVLCAGTLAELADKLRGEK